MVHGIDFVLHHCAACARLATASSAVHHELELQQRFDRSEVGLLQACCCVGLDVVGVREVNLQVATGHIAEDPNSNSLV